MTTWKLAPILAAAALAGLSSPGDALGQPSAAGEGSALADRLPKLPVALKLPQSGESPGVVTFNHDMHVDTSRPDCLSCHPRRFGILGRSATARRPAVTHASMEKGEACGGCHGKAAFNFDDCTMCHAM